MIEHIELTEEEINRSREFHDKRIEYLINLGKIKLSEIDNENKTEENYFNLTELNTRERQFLDKLSEKYGQGTVDLSINKYIKKYKL
jgi:hypothetical protein